ncbi:hypothetical protein JJC04_00535 [Flavobacterium covae]|nr:hypothetical protein [Flavobacterium covae]QYS91383.1 hypothetical protein JJC04_00535 [Flavobacterium covae]
MRILEVGLVHLTNNIPISKFDLLRMFNSIFEKQIIIKGEKDYTCDKSFLNTNEAIAYQVPSYVTMINEQKKFMKNHSELYKY